MTEVVPVLTDFLNAFSRSSTEEEGKKSWRKSQFIKSAVMFVKSSILCAVLQQCRF